MVPRIVENVGRGLAAGLALAGVGYLALVVRSRRRYGRVPRAGVDDRSHLLDRYIPVPEVLDHHQVEIEAPPAIVLAAALDMELLNRPIVRALIRTREFVLGGRRDARPHPEALLAQMLSIGWVVLAERPGQEIALGAVTQPWYAAPVFRSIPGDQFAAFHEPGYVKIAWSLRAQPTGRETTRFHVETRVCTSDLRTRARFRRYWSYVAPGVGLIRLAMLQPLRREAERRAVAFEPAEVEASARTSASSAREQ